MRFITTCVLTSGKSEQIEFPNLTRISKVPCKITITEEVREGEEIASTGILCRIHAGGVEVGNYGEPSFRLTNEMDLSPYKGVVDRTGRVSVLVTNRTTDPKRLKFYIDYEKSMGGLLIEEKIDHFANVLNTIYNAGFCTKLIISFSRQVNRLEFASIAECEDSDGQWIEPFNVPIDKDLDIEDQVYTIDFTQKDLGAWYSDNLNFLVMRVEATKKDKDEPPLYMYISAYGFPWTHK
jgi:hypothetical protein